MLSVTLGPLAIPVYTALTALAIAIFWLMTYLSTRGSNSQSAATEMLFRAVVVGFLVARLAFVIALWEEYQNDWFQIINIRDGGFIHYYGWGAAIAVLVLSAWGDRKITLAYVKSSVITLLVVLPLFLAVMLSSEGRALPQTAVYDAKGRKVTLSSFSGKPIVLNFWASWCPPCLREMPVLEEAQRTNPQTTFLFVNQGETTAEVRHFFNTQGFSLDNVFYDPASLLGRESGASGLPTTLFFYADGTLAESHMGELSGPSLSYYLKKLRAEPQNN